MKRLLLFTVLTFVLVSVSQAASEKQECKSKKYSEGKLEAKCKVAEATKTHCEQYRKDHGTGFDKFKKHHKDLICQLKEMRDIAVKENATQTVKAIDEMITKTQKRFHESAKFAKACPSDCVKPCCDAKKKAGTCPKLKGDESCPLKCPKTIKQKEATTCSKK